jgi:hypothetical protein
MLERLRAKDIEGRVVALAADMSDFDLQQRYGLVYIVQHTFYCLPDQRSQQACLRAARDHLEESGHLVVEGSVLHTDAWSDNQIIKVIAVENESVTMRIGLYDPVSQEAVTQHVTLDRGGVSLRPLRLRYCSVAELDLMAETVGLRLVDRHSGWQREPFTARSRKHVSVYVAR